MPDIIHLLPDAVANQIAAGEVIQRPASVIKELVENAVDAGATNVDVYVVDAGRTMIQVADNGKGMSETDARLAFERHATSKILKAEDLFSLKTMGFRGEALPSIAAVSQLTLRTRQADKQLGTKIRIEGGNMVSQEVDMCAAGSCFTVCDLFYNLPARRKFLRTNQTELNNIVAEFERLALVNPSVSFTFNNNGSLVTSLPESSVLQRISGIFGKKMNAQLLEVDVDTTLCRLKGFVGRPDSSRKKGAHQYFFVNGRYMRHPYFHKAVVEAYSGLIPEGEQVPYFLYFEVDPACIDVNIHPTKTEIKFENEQAIWQIIMAAIKESLGKFNAVPIIDFDVAGQPGDIPVYTGTSVQRTMPEVTFDGNFNPFGTSRDAARPASSASSVPSASLASSASTVPIQAVPTRSMLNQDNFLPDVQTAEPQQQELYSAESLGQMEKSSDYYQYRGQYIVTAVKSGLMFIDQHRAHARVLYNRYRTMLEGQTTASQGLLFPELLQLPVSDAVIMDSIMDDLRQLGFDLSPLGGGAFSVLGVPASIEGVDPLALLNDIVSSVRDTGRGATEELHHRLALVMARHAALPVGQVLSKQEMETLVADLFATESPNYTPDGKVVLNIIMQENIEKMFR